LKIKQKITDQSTHYKMVLSEHHADLDCPQQLITSLLHSEFCADFLSLKM